MAQQKITCPECGAGLRSPTGFTVGQAVFCQKCETEFTVRARDLDAPEKATTNARRDDPDDYDRGAAGAPAGGKKKRGGDYDRDEPVRSYKNSPLRYAVLGVLVVTMLVLGYFLYRKWQDEREVARRDPAAEEQAPDQQFQPLQPPQLKGAPGPGRPVGKGPGGPKGPKMPNPKLPNPKPPDANPAIPALPIDPFGGLLGGQPDAKTAAALVEKLSAELVGTWTADLGGGVTEELMYAKDGAFAAKRTGPNAAEEALRYTVVGPAGNKGLKVRLATPTGAPARTITVSIVGGELEHPSLEKGVTGTFRRK